MNKKKIILRIVLLLIVIGLVSGISFAAFKYGLLGENTGDLVLGDIYMHYDETNSFSISVPVPGIDYSKTEYFEFIVRGKNTYSDKDIWYDINLTRGDVPEGKNEDYRIPDEYLDFKLVEVVDEEEVIVFTDRFYSDLASQRVHVETINKNTLSEVNKKYRLYMKVNNSLVIGNSDRAVFSFEEWGQAFASVKVNVTGDFEEKEVESDQGSLATDTVKANVVSYTEASATDFSGGLVGINGTEGSDYGLLYNENNQAHTIREYRYVGPTVNNYIYYNCPNTAEGYNYGDIDYPYQANCEVWRIVGIFKENDEEYLKIMRNTTLEAGTIPTTFTYGGTTYSVGYSTSSAEARVYWNAKSSGTNNNDWTTAGLQYYLNKESDANWVGGYLSTLSSTSKDLIRETTYYLGNVVFEKDTTLTAYDNERKDVMCSSSVTSDTHNNGCNIWSGNQPSWNGKVALLYPSDYGYSALPTYWSGTKLYSYDGSAVKASTWMQQTANHSSDEWLLAPASIYSILAIDWNSSGSLGNGSVVAVANSVRSVLNLKSQTEILKGEGTSNSPYVVIEK